MGAVWWVLTVVAAIGTLWCILTYHEPMRKCPHCKKPIKVSEL